MSVWSAEIRKLRKTEKLKASTKVERYDRKGNLIVATTTGEQWGKTVSLKRITNIALRYPGERWRVQVEDPDPENKSGLEWWEFDYRDEVWKSEIDLMSGEVCE